LKVRARRRLIGAVALLLAAVILVPLLLDPAPRPTVDNIPIDIPSDRQPFTPRLSLPPVPDPGQTPLAPPPDLPAETDRKSEQGAKGDATKAEATKSARPAGETQPPAKETPPPAKAPESKPPEAKAPEARAKQAEPRAAEVAAKAKSGRIVLQAAALSTDAAAQDLSERLRKAGFAPFTEKVDTADGVRFRVRVGPYPTRDEAQRAQARLRTLGVSATLVTT
jgi:DedD protein